MSTDFRADLESFHQYIGKRLAAGEIVSPGEALELWLNENPQPEGYEQRVAALQRELDEIDAGVPGIPLDDYERRFRERHNLPPVE